MEVSCCICNKLHQKKKSRATRNKINFCSQECYHQKKFIQFEAICTNCGIKCTKKRKDNEQAWCSPKCYTKFYYKNNPEKYEIYKNNAVIRSRAKRATLPRKKLKNGEGNVSPDGYKRLQRNNHPFADKRGQIFEHTLVMCEFLGRRLFKRESVHHKNGDKLDNRIENLELWCKGQPAGQRVEDRIKFYIEFLDQYGYDVKKRG